MHRFLKASRGTLIQAAELMAALGKTPIRILDTTVGRPIADMDNNAVYKKERIPGATMVDIDKVADHSTPGISHQTPNEADFSKFMAELDVSNKDEVVLYDDNFTAGACKFYFTFRQYGMNPYILDGGFNAWKKAGGPIETGPESYKHRKLDPKLYQFKVKEHELMDANDVNACSYLMRNKDLDYEILDARAGPRFRMEVDEPRPGLRRGNIPGSKNVFFKDLLNADGTFKSNDELKAIFKKSEVDLNKNIVMSCGSSVTASVIYYALNLIGHKKNRFVYGPSWSEYGKTSQISDEDIAKNLSKSKWYSTIQKK
jgi:thiosulfate/3-mercaptopyruvate sulfurtransferase